MNQGEDPTKIIFSIYPIGKQLFRAVPLNSLHVNAATPEPIRCGFGRYSVREYQSLEGLSHCGGLGIFETQDSVHGKNLIRKRCLNYGDFLGPLPYFFH